MLLLHLLVVSTLILQQGKVWRIPTPNTSRFFISSQALSLVPPGAALCLGILVHERVDFREEPSRMRMSYFDLSIPYLFFAEGCGNLR